jgi:hypothetical protein
MLKSLYSIPMIFKFLPKIAIAIFIFLPIDVSATQLHASSEGVITHQMGHLFFLFSMAALIFTVTGKDLDKQKGWRLIQYSAFFFILWNLDAIATHFLDNQILAVKIENISLTRIKVVTHNDSAIIGWLYYFLKLDHLLCVPAMYFLYKGLSRLVNDQRLAMTKKDTP